MMPFTLPFTTTMGVVNRVHSNTTNDGAASEPPTLTSLAKLLGTMGGVRDRPNGGSAPSVDQLLDAGGEADEDAAGGGGLLKDLGGGTGGTDKLAAFARAELDVVDEGPNSHHGDGHATSDLGR